MSGCWSLVVDKGGRRPCAILVNRSNGPLRERADIARRRGVSTDNHSLFNQTKEGEKYCEKNTLQSTAFDDSRGGISFVAQCHRHCLNCEDVMRRPPPLEDGRVAMTTNYGLLWGAERTQASALSAGD